MPRFKHAALAAATALQFLVTTVFATEPTGKVLARLEVTSSGCFHLEHNVIQLIQSGKGVIATLSVRDQTQELKLTDNQLRSVHQFFNELKALREETGCTSVSTYVLKTDDGVLKKTDGGCVWNGYYQLRKALFGK